MESQVKNLLKRLVQEEAGQDVIEYALLAAGISIAVIPALPTLAAAVNAVYGRVEVALNGVGG